MSSPTKVHKRRKVLKSIARGRKRKNHDRNHGTTAPNLPLDKPNANELKQKAAHAAKKASAPKAAAKKIVKKKAPAAK